MVALKSASSGISKIFSISFLMVFLIIELVQIIYLSISSRSIGPVLTELGGKFLLTTQGLSETSKEIITNGGIQSVDVNLSQNPLSGTWNFIKQFSSFYSSFYTIFLWLKILTWIYARTPFSTKDKVFKNVSLAVFTFLFLQSALIMSNAAISHSVDCFSNCGERSVIYYLSIPIRCFKDFFQAIGVIINSIRISR